MSAHSGRNAGSKAGGEASGRDTVLLLHGLWMNGFVMSWLAHALDRAGFRTEAVDYRGTRDGMDAHVDRLAQAVAQTQGARIHIVGHSMGGVIAMRYLAQSGDTRSSRSADTRSSRSADARSSRLADARVCRLVLLGAPVRGSQAARDFEGHALGRMLLGASVALWRAPFEPRVPAGFEVGAIAGTNAFGLGALFVTLPGENDGVVTVEETRIDGLRDHIVLPVSHTGMLMSDPVAAQTAAFLAHGRFER